MTTTAPRTDDWRAKSARQTRLAFGQALLEIGARDPKAVVLSADTQDLIGIRQFIELFPDRFIEIGIAEQNTVGASSGLATTGLHPYICGYAPFISARSMEQVRNDVAYANQRVVIGADERLRTIPIVIVSTSDREEDVRFALDHGVRAYISKSKGFDRFTEDIADVTRYVGEPRP